MFEQTRSMMKTILSAIISLLLIALAVSSFGNPFLTAIPTDDLADYYVISIDGEESQQVIDFDMSFFHDTKQLTDGKHSLELKVGSNEHGLSDPIKFFITKKTDKKWITYEIEKDMTQVSGDPQYVDRFVSPQILRFENPEYEFELIKEIVTLREKIKELEQRIKDLESK